MKFELDGIVFDTDEELFTPVLASYDDDGNVFIYDGCIKRRYYTNCVDHEDLTVYKYTIVRARIISIQLSYEENKSRISNFIIQRIDGKGQVKYFDTFYSNSGMCEYYPAIISNNEEVLKKIINEEYINAINKVFKCKPKKMPIYIPLRQNEI